MGEETGAYLIVAFYNRNKWNALKPEQKHAAHEAAEVLFPENTTPVTGPQGKGGTARIAQSFASDLFPKLSPRYKALEKAEMDLFVDGIYATAEPNPRVGWMEIIAADALAGYLELLCTNGSALWKMYDIEIHPLRAAWDLSDLQGILPALKGDKTTQNVYDDMTPRNWSI